MVLIVCSLHIVTKRFIIHSGGAEDILTCFFQPENKLLTHKFKLTNVQTLKMTFCTLQNAQMTPIKVM